MTKFQDPLRWGILSTAKISRSVIPSIHASRRNKLYAIASRDLEKGTQFAKEFEIERVYGSYDAIVASDEIDVIYNPLPNSLHAEWTIKAAQAGKHVLCEKPIGITVEEVDAISDAASKNKVVIAEAFMYRHTPQTLKVKEWVERGSIGEVKLIRGSFTFNIADEKNIRLNADLGGGSIWDVGCYPISYARHILGSEPIDFWGQAIIGDSGVDETFIGAMRFENGAFAQFDSGFRSPFRTHLEIVGSAGIIVVPRPFKPAKVETVYIGSAMDQLVPTRIEGFDLLYSGEIEDMADAIIDGAAPRVSLYDSRANIDAIQKLLASAAEKKRANTEN
jgi:predicted dehydrogenase